MFADKKSHSPESAASGVKQAIFVDFIMWPRYFRRSLDAQGKKVRKQVLPQQIDVAGNAVRDPSADVNSVLPFELRPHTSELHGQSNNVGIGHKGQRHVLAPRCNMLV